MKFYEAPACRQVELSPAANLLVGSHKTDPFDGNTEETPEVE